MLLAADVIWHILSCKHAYASETKNSSRISQNTHAGNWLYLDKASIQKSAQAQAHLVQSYTIIQQMSPNAFKLELPPQVGIHDVVNVSQILLYKPPHLKESVPITHQETTIPDFQPSLLENNIFNVCTISPLCIVKSPLTWWSTKALCPLKPSVYPS